MRALEPPDAQVCSSNARSDKGRLAEGLGWGDVCLTDFTAPHLPAAPGKEVLSHGALVMLLLFDGEERSLHLFTRKRNFS